MISDKRSNNKEKKKETENADLLSGLGEPHIVWLMWLIPNQLNIAYTICGPKFTQEIATLNIYI